MLAGGAARRMSGADKPGMTVGARSLLERVVAAVADAGRVVVVGPARDLDGVVFTREDPPGGGPVRALRAGLAEVTAPQVVVLAADLPFLLHDHVVALRAAAAGAVPPIATAAGSEGVDPAVGVGGGATGSEGAGARPGQRRGPSAGRSEDTISSRGGDSALGLGGGGEAESSGGVVLVDEGGREQWLTSVWPTNLLREALARYEGDSLRGLLGPLKPRRVALPGRAWFDCDTMDDLEEARMNVLTEWTALVCKELGVDPAAVDRDLILDLTKEVAHGVARPAAPLTAYLLGLAQGAGTAPEDAVAKLTTLARNWERATTETLTDG
ncbi:NTP transferase domain-containing protein [Nonomuraea sp. NPDC050310]|uniref:NTP transferase domain-containing protein n=2 Tax=unclassified Nonomuraea TaxID=2593643 RepID=UPI003400CE49